MDGLLLVNKPKDWTSFDVVAKIRGILKKSGVTKPKVGHTGTLDPQATGLLVLTLGTYCKRAGEFSKLDKTYEVELELGKTSTTDDSEGEITTVSSEEPAKEAVEQAVNSFVGTIEQIPPVFSAIKVNGKRAYKMAREGKEVALEARPVTIYTISNLMYVYPKVTFSAKVSSGTYIRSLARDIGQKLGTGAYMSDLKRIEVGEFALDAALSVEALIPETIHDSLLQK